jgi:hypothetical protein
MSHEDARLQGKVHNERERYYARYHRHCDKIRTRGTADRARENLIATAADHNTMKTCLERI